jgi:hypothetical protein
LIPFDEEPESPAERPRSNLPPSYLPKRGRSRRLESLRDEQLHQGEGFLGTQDLGKLRVQAKIRSLIHRPGPNVVLAASSIPFLGIGILTGRWRQSRRLGRVRRQRRGLVLVEKQRPQSLTSLPAKSL